MRFRKGSRVEVMNQKNVPISWHNAEILADNGHTYGVMYDFHPGMNNESRLDRVSKKFVRPCPPPLQGGETWRVGDIVEVFEDFSWKIASILKVLPGDSYLVRLIGCSIESTMQKSSIRERWIWLDDKWILLGKTFGACEIVQANPLSTSNFKQKMSFQVLQSDKEKLNQALKECLDVQNNDLLQESIKVSSRSLKRMSPYCSTVIESHNGNIQKFRVVEKDGRKQKVASAPSREKVHTVVNPRGFMGEVHMHASFDNRTNGHNEPDGDVVCSLAESVGPHDSDSDASSVGSCSVVSRRLKRFPSHVVSVPCQMTDSFYSDAESFCGSEDCKRSCSLHFSEEEGAASIHGLELHAYHSTLVALHASGPITWEQETLLTNLRIVLHITNDEHLMEHMDSS